MFHIQLLTGSLQKFTDNALSKGAKTPSTEADHTARIYIFYSDAPHQDILLYVCDAAVSLVCDRTGTEVKSNRRETN